MNFKIRYISSIYRTMKKITSYQFKVVSDDTGLHGTENTLSFLSRCQIDSIWNCGAVNSTSVFQAVIEISMFRFKHISGKIFFACFVSMIRPCFVAVLILLR